MFCLGWLGSFFGTIWKASAKGLAYGFAVIPGIISVSLAYWFNRQALKKDAAKIILFEIGNVFSNTEEFIVKLKDFQNSQSEEEQGKNNLRLKEVTRNLSILPNNSWAKQTHLLVGFLSSHNVMQISKFYNLGTLAQNTLSKIQNYLPISLEEKVKQSQITLAQIAKKYSEKWDDPVFKEKYGKERDIFLEIYGKEGKGDFHPSIMDQELNALCTSLFEMKTELKPAIKKLEKIVKI